MADVGCCKFKREPIKSIRLALNLIKQPWLEMTKEDTVYIKNIVVCLYSPVSAKKYRSVRYGMASNYTLHCQNFSKKYQNNHSIPSYFLAPFCWGSNSLLWYQKGGARHTAANVAVGLLIYYSSKFYNFLWECNHSDSSHEGHLSIYPSIHPSIHPSSAAYLWSGCGGSSFSRGPQTSLSLATSANFDLGIPKCSQAGVEI